MDKIEVTQADRDAAEHYNRVFPEIRLIEAFARHRIAHQPLHAQADGEKLTDGPQYLLVKRGLYYAPDYQGYTAIKSQAGRYYEDDDRDSSDITAIHEDEAGDWSPACTDGTKIDHLTRVNAELVKEVAQWKRSADEWCRRHDALHAALTPHVAPHG